MVSFQLPVLHAQVEHFGTALLDGAPEMLMREACVWEVFFPMARQPLGCLGRLIFRGFTITQFRHTTFGRTPLDECEKFTYHKLLTHLIKVM